jgi:transposase
MRIIGCDFHSGFQQIAWYDAESGETGGARLQHREEAERFYRALAGEQVRVGIEATGGTRWFERLLGELGFEVWFGDPAKIRAKEPRKQKTDARDAELLLRLLRSGEFEPLRIWVPSMEERDERQLLLHRHRLVQMRTRVKNQVQAIAKNEGVCRRAGLWTVKGQAEFRALPLAPWADQRRRDSLELLSALNGRIDPLDDAVAQLAKQRPAVQLLMTHPGVGPVVASAFVLTLGTWRRFESAKQVASYVGLIPAEASSGGRQRLGHLTKQGNAFLRGLLVEAAHIAVRYEPQWRRAYLRMSLRKNRQIAVVAIARKLAMRLWWIWKTGLAYGQMVESGSHAE